MLFTALNIMKTNNTFKKVSLFYSFQIQNENYLYV